MEKQIVEQKDGKFQYRIKNKGRILFHSEGYDSKSNAKRALNKFLLQIEKLRLSRTVELEYSGE